MTSSIFCYIESELKNKNVEVSTIRRNFKGVVRYCDSVGNISLMTNEGLVLIQRKFLVSIQVLQEEVEK